jgi:hypothetical protein
MLRGGLFTHEYLLEGIKDSEAWKTLNDARIVSVRAEIEKRLSAIQKLKKPNEAETEKELIWPALEALEWHDTLPQQNLSVGGREKVPDGLLFGDGISKAKAAAEKSWSRFSHGLCIMEAKRWNRLLDRKDKADSDDPGIPSNQILSYLRRVDDVTRGKLRWGILTNGRVWRLYFQGADSVAEEFLEIDLAGVFGLPGYSPDLLEDRRISADHVFRLFVLLFGRAAFLPGHRGQTLHALFRDQGKHWEAKVANDLSRLVFDDIFPKLVNALAATDPERDQTLSDEYLDQLRNGALIFLYRLLFVLYAEDRNLLPDDRGPYKELALTRLRDEIADKKAARSEFSDRVALYWARLETIFNAVGEGDDKLGIPPYNGGLFQKDRAPILTRAKLPDNVMAEIIFGLSHEKPDLLLPRYINYRDLSVQQLGSIYERLLEYDVVAENKTIKIRLNPFARKGSGSYYTPEPLVKLIVERAVGPLVSERIERFKTKAEELQSSRRPLTERIAELSQLDPASAILELKVCDPAMGSGHFLVSLVDWMADQILTAIEDAANVVNWTDYESPLIARVATIRSRIAKRAKEHNWPVPERQLDDRNIVRRMILKRCVYGVDLNPMAVELAKVSLWLHTFTVGAPLSFLDHHLRCGNSLFGEHVRGALDWLAKRGNVLVGDIIKKAMALSVGMQKIEALTDADIAEVKESKAGFESVETGTRPIANLLDFVHVVRWQQPSDENVKKFVNCFLDGQYGDPLRILNGRPATDAAFANFYARCRQQIAEQRFLHWEVAFPGVWSNWASAQPRGGFDAVIGNPPWDRIKFQEIEWFAARKPEIAHAQRASDRKKMAETLKKKHDPLALAYERAVEAAEAQARVARSTGDYPLLSVGDTNIYSLFVERGARLIKSDGLVGLLTPSGIASDKTAADFFKSVATTGRLSALFDFENKKVFFPDVHASFKFCALVIGGTARRFNGTDCGFYLHDVVEIDDPTRSFVLMAKDFACVNPNTGTAPIFRTRQDAEITKGIYERFPVLVNRSASKAVATYPVKYFTMFHMTNDSNLFVTPDELAKTAYLVDGTWKRGNETFLPLYEGKMVQMYDHRAANVIVNLGNLNRPAMPESATIAQHGDPSWRPEPQYWVSTESVDWAKRVDWAIGFKDVTAPTNIRTMIVALIPRAGVGNTLPLVIQDIPGDGNPYKEWAHLLAANFNAIPFDFVARQKVQGQHLNWFIVEQLPVVPRDAYARKFGKKSAADIVKDDVLALTYTASDMEPFARDMGYMGKPFVWDEADRARRRARLDAVYFMLYFPSASKAEIEALREMAEYIFSTFPIVEREDIAAHGRYLSRDLCLAYVNALAAGDPDAMVDM